MNQESDQVRERIEAIRERIREACGQVGRDPSGVRIVGVAKGFPPEVIKEVVWAGINEIGENYLQEGLRKQKTLQDFAPVVWHFIGHLQQNKALHIAERFNLIHAVDSLPLAETLDHAGRKLGKRVQALLQLKGNPGGYGLTGDEITGLQDRLPLLEWVEWRGIMILAPPADDPEEIRPFFRDARKIFQRLKEKFAGTFRELSMGMTGDFPVAVEEGATLLRIGRGIFGPRVPIEKVCGGR